MGVWFAALGLLFGAACRPAAASMPTPPLDTPLAPAGFVASVSPVFLPLVGELAAPAAEISGLAWYGSALVFLPQYPQRFDDALFWLPEEEILAALAGNLAELRPRRLALHAPGLSDLPGYEGLEAIAFAGDQVFVTVEARQGLSSMTGYVIAGRIEPDLSAITLDVAGRQALPAQAKLPNYSDEALVVLGETLVTFYEANGLLVNPAPVARQFALDLTPLPPLALPHLEYRLTDASELDGEGRFWVINYLFPGDWDKLTPAEDTLTAAYPLATPHSPEQPVERLVALEYTETGLRLAPAPPVEIALSPDGAARNWEGLALLDDQGFLLVTDQHPSTLFAFIPRP